MHERYVIIVSIANYNKMLIREGGADIFLDYFMLIIQGYVCTLPGSYIREIFIRFVLIAVKLIYEIFHRDAYP